MISGAIILWSGSIVNIPAGYALCDGTNGTPDLTDKFVYGAGGALAPGASGGSAVHNHDFTTDGHDHSLNDGDPLVAAGGGSFDFFVNNQTDTGTTDNGSTIPPYLSLAYIMFL